MAYYYYPSATNDRSYHHEMCSYEIATDSAGNSKKRLFSSAYQTNDTSVREDPNMKKRVNIEQNDKTNSVIDVEELKLDTKMNEDPNTSLKERVKHLITVNTLLSNIYDSLYQNHQMLTEEMTNIKQDNVNLKRINDELTKNKTNFEANYNKELTNKLNVMEETNWKFKNEFANLTADNTKLQCESKSTKEESGQIDVLNKEIIQLKKKCESYEDEFVYLSEELQNTREEISELNERNNELLIENKDLNQKNKDLKHQCDNMECENCELKSEIRQIKHEIRETKAENTQQKNSIEILEKEKETLLNKCKKNDGEKDKIVKENKKFNDLIQEFQRFVQKKFRKLDDDEDKESEKNSYQNQVEIHPNSGIFCRASDWKKLEKCEIPKEFCKKLLHLIFTTEELLKCSLNGKGNKPALNRAKLDALNGSVLNRFPSHTQSDITKWVNKTLSQLRLTVMMEKYSYN